MVRATASCLLVGGVVLLITWGVRPAESQATRTAPLSAADAGIPAEIHDINLEVDRLIAHLSRQSEASVPVRDPFSFAGRTRAPRVDVPAIETTITEPPVVQPAWPVLVAIMSAASGGALEAALTDSSGTLHVVATGAAVGAVAVSDVTSDSVVLTDTVSGQTTRLSIR